MAKNLLTVLLCVNNPINFLLKNITLYNFFIIYGRKELANETFRREGKFTYKMCARNLLHTSFYRMSHVPSACHVIFHWWQNVKGAKFRLPLTFLHKRTYIRTTWCVTYSNVCMNDWFLRYLTSRYSWKSCSVERDGKMTTNIKLKMSNYLSLF
jgi:hypothetical protein